MKRLKKMMSMNRNDILKNMIMQNPEEDFSYYENILNEIDENTNYPDIFSETVSKIFKSVITGKIDPWRINIMEFGELFYREKNDNFEIAGILIASAWHILYEKSLMMINRNVTENQDNENTEDYDNLDFEYIKDQAGKENKVKNMINLREPVLHEEIKNVTLVELFNAMEKVYKKKEKIIENERKFDINTDILSKANKDSIGEGINQTLEKIKRYINPFYVEDYWGETKNERSEFLLYLLFLEKNGKIVMEQNEPYGDIMVTKLF